MTACDYKFFPARAAHTKTLKPQQQKGQSKPSSPSYYNKSLVPASVFALITIVPADENKNNSGHSKINLNLISSRLSLKIRAVDDAGRGERSHLQRLECHPGDVLGCSGRSPPHARERGKINRYSCHGSNFGNRLNQLRCPVEPGPLPAAFINSLQHPPSGRHFEGPGVAGIHKAHTGFAWREGSGREEGRMERSTLQPPYRGGPGRIRCQMAWVSAAHLTVQRKAEIPVMEIKVVYL